MGVDAGKVIDVMAKTGLLEELIGLIGGLLKRAPKPAPPVVYPTQPVTQPTPQDPDFPDDDTIPVPVGNRVVKKVHLHLTVRLPKSRFPEAYANGGNGFVDGGAILRGESAMNWGSKFWVDLTAKDQDGHEFLPEAVVAYGLAYKTEHHAGETFIKGHGADANGEPNAGYETQNTEEISNGDTAWRSTRGFKHQFKCWPASDGKSYELWGSVDGVETEHYTIKIS